VSLWGLTEESAATKVQELTLCSSCEVLTIVDNLSLTVEKKRIVDTIITAIKYHIDGHINESMECHKLRQHVQQLRESFGGIMRAC